MSRLAAQIGIWATASQLLLSVLYLAGFVVILAAHPFASQTGALPDWTGVGAFAAGYDSTPMRILTAVQVVAFLQALHFLVIVLVIHELASPARRVLTRLGAAWALVFVVLASITYIVQVVAVRQSVRKGELEGLAPFVMYNLDSPMAALNTLGWSFFSGLATLFVAFVFQGPGLERWIKWGLVVYGVAGVGSGVAYAAGAKGAVGVYLAAMLLTAYVYPLLIVVFRRRAAPEDAGLQGG